MHFLPIGNQGAYGQVLRSTLREPPPPPTSSSFPPCSSLSAPLPPCEAKKYEIFQSGDTTSMGDAPYFQPLPEMPMRAGETERVPPPNSAGHFSLLYAANIHTSSSIDMFSYGTAYTLKPATYTAPSSIICPRCRMPSASSPAPPTWPITNHQTAWVDTLSIATESDQTADDAWPPGYKVHKRRETDRASQVSIRP